MHEQHSHAQVLLAFLSAIRLHQRGRGPDQLGG